MKRRHEKIWGNLGVMEMLTTLIVVVVLQVYTPIKLIKLYTLMYNQLHLHRTAKKKKDSQWFPILGLGFGLRKYFLNLVLTSPTNTSRKNVL